MKALIKGGLCLALGWLANGADAQEIVFRAAKNAHPLAVVNTPPKGSDGERPVTLRPPSPLEPGNGPTGFAPIIRAQVQDDKTVTGLPKLEIMVKEPKTPAPMPRGEGFPPAPQVVPSPIFGNLMPDPGSFGDCSPMEVEPGRFGGPGLFAGYSGDGSGVERSRFWASAEYLMWWQRAQTLPPLVIAGPPAAPTVLFDSLPSQTHSGGRFFAGMWMPHFCCNLGIEAGFFFLGRQTSTSVFPGDGVNTFSRPFFDTTNNIQNGEIFASNNFQGSTTITSYTQLWGFETNLRYKWHNGPNHWIDIIGGYRQVSLSEGLSISEDTTNPAVFFGAVRNIRSVELDSFRTQNNFYGVQIGLDSEFRFLDRWFFGMSGKVAMGTVHQIINIDGTTTFTDLGPVQSFTGNRVAQGGLLALPGTNIGRYTNNRFGVLPEVNFKVGVDVTDRLRLFVGYNFLYLNNVVRPGEQIDLNVNTTYRQSLQQVGNNIVPVKGLSVGNPVPGVLFRTTDYWAQGINFGLLYRY